MTEIIISDKVVEDGIAEMDRQVAELWRKRGVALPAPQYSAMNDSDKTLMRTQVRAAITAAILADRASNERVREAVEKEREACAQVIESLRDHESASKVCCGNGLQTSYDEPPECCCDPDIIIPIHVVAAAIRSRSIPTCEAKDE